MSNKINKIQEKYCINDKVQVMLSTASNSILFSPNELLYYNDKEKEIHKYLSDDDRLNMPFHQIPKTKKTTNHLFHFDDIYIHYTNNLYIESGLLLEGGYGYGLVFKMFKRLPDGNAITEDYYLNDFEYRSKHEIITDENGINEFLYGKDDEVRAIFTNRGIMYYCSKKDGKVVDKYNIDLSDDAVVKKYNSEEAPIKVVDYCKIMSGIKETKEEEPDESWKKQSASEITDYSIVTHKYDQVYPMIVKIVNGDIYVSEFDILYLSTNKYKIIEKRYCISKETFDINTSYDNSINYLYEPKFVDGEYVGSLSVDEEKNLTDTPVKKKQFIKRFTERFKHKNQQK